MEIGDIIVKKEKCDFGGKRGIEYHEFDYPVLRITKNKIQVRGRQAHSEYFPRFDENGIEITYKINP